MVVNLKPYFENFRLRWAYTGDDRKKVDKLMWGPSQNKMLATALFKTHTLVNIKDILLKTVNTE